jgi:hypothetical protein
VCSTAQADRFAARNRMMCWLRCNWGGVHRISEASHGEKTVN